MTRTITLASLAAAFCLPSLATAETIIALKEDASPYLISFDSTAPRTITGRLNITGLPTLPTRAQPLTVEFRPNGGLYLIVQGLPTTADCALYTVNTATGFASPVGNSTFSCAEVGDADIDPRADQMRVINGTQNYRLTLGTGFSASVTKSSGNAVAFKAGDPNLGDTPDIVALAYDQNVASSANTTLFAVDAGNDSLVIVGTTSATATTSVDGGELTTFGTTGLGVPVTNAAFDISGSPAGTGYLYVWEKTATPNANGFYTVALTGGSLGTATFVGPVGDGSGNILSLTTVPGTIFLPPPPVAAVPLDDGGAAPWSLFGLLAALGLWRRRSHR
ncbi:MAG: hypothetical protein K0Q68_3216 [Moraxellaceae bacterium]|nr:hypothetical protein [Moraxellaceae bacterium]